MSVLRADRRRAATPARLIYRNDVPLETLSGPAAERGPEGGGMRVGEVMTRGVEFVGLDATIQEAATLMAEHDIGAVLVGSAEALAGILTDRDILLRVIVEGADPVRSRVGGVMSSSVFHCGIDTTIDEALREMHERQIRRLPVVDEEGRVLGIVVRSVLAQASRAAREAPAAGEPLTGDESAAIR